MFQGHGSKHGLLRRTEGPDFQACAKYKLVPLGFPWKLLFALEPGSPAAPTIALAPQAGILHLRHVGTENCLLNELPLAPGLAASPSGGGSSY